MEKRTHGGQRSESFFFVFSFLFFYYASHCPGVYNYHFGDSYEGTFLRGFRYGTGRYRYRDGGYYQGEYKNTQNAAGKGTGKLPLCDGKRHGVGLRVWSTGVRYEGQWVEDVIHGVGCLTTLLGAKYEGPFFNGLR